MVDSFGMLVDPGCCVESEADGLRAAVEGNAFDELRDGLLSLVCGEMFPG